MGLETCHHDTHDKYEVLPNAENTATSREEELSTQKSLSAAHDSGWNDPPKWAYTPATNSSNTPTKRVLNKRVAFPLGSAPPVSNFDPYQPLSPPPVNMPPPPLAAATITTAPHAPLVAPTCATLENTSVLVEVGKEQALKDTLENLETVMNEHEELKCKAEEIRRRLDVMKTVWIKDQLNGRIHQKVLDISHALRNKDVETADKIHVSLMMDHAALCSSWITGIRHLILGLKEIKASPNALQDAIASPFLLPTSATQSAQ